MYKRASVLVEEGFPKDVLYQAECRSWPEQVICEKQVLARAAGGRASLAGGVPATLLTYLL